MSYSFVCFSQYLLQIFFASNNIKHNSAKNGFAAHVLPQQQEHPLSKWSFFKYFNTNQ